MVALSTPIRPRPLHPLHAICLGAAFPLFAGALASDFAYRATYEVQWANFSSWLIAGGLLVSAGAVLWAFINLFRRRPGGTDRRGLYFALLLVMWVLGFLNALVHAKDAWATMPEGLYLSAVTTALALAAAWIGHAAGRME
ncbi:DUF2231 domain-containing protein [Paracoccus luteus]|uniref:DUF2231 domain-containing protein n=1 Tax=Paracoccus luteus TaxID=2508543 RepID=UPI0010702251|nr:DUF2231 domain-containing protein [Paracoccus luteus]